MITLQGMADNRLTSVYFLPIYFLVIFFPPKFLVFFLICLMIKSKNTESHIYGQALHSLYDFCMTFLQTLYKVMA